MRISDWSSTCALPICSVFFFSLGQKTERPFDTLRANGRGGIAIFVSDTKPTLYSIPVHRAFADAIAAGLIARARKSGRVGKECVSKGRSGWWLVHVKKNNKYIRNSCRHKQKK